MSQALRLSEKWFRRALWLVAVVFAFFLINLGGLVVNDLPGVPPLPSVNAFRNSEQAHRIQATLDHANQQVKANADAEAQAKLQWQIHQANYQSARDSLTNWLATRQVTQLASQNPEVVQRTQALDALKAAEQTARQALEQIQQKQLTDLQQLAQAQAAWDNNTEQAQRLWHAAAQRDELKVFGIRLSLTLPLLVIAAWLFNKKRKSAYWPFVWGFVLFALYTFFVELVPYLPDYGGYVRYTVGVVLTLLLGRYLIFALQRYLAAQKAKEALPEQERHHDLSYDIAQKRLSQGICPGCERAVDLNDTSRNFCIHCGICLFNQCLHCHTRKNAFGHHCHACGGAEKK